MRFIYWSLSSAFFFAAAVIVISILKPGPTETQVMKYMHGMMSAMHNSMMGAAMEDAGAAGFLMGYSAYLSVVTILLGVIAGVFLRLRRKA